jgi:hypothetical protein
VSGETVNLLRLREDLLQCRKRVLIHRRVHTRLYAEPVVVRVHVVGEHEDVRVSHLALVLEDRGEVVPVDVQVRDEDEEQPTISCDGQRSGLLTGAFFLSFLPFPPVVP